MSKNVLVMAETKHGKLRGVSLELLSAARRAAGEGIVSAVVAGTDGKSYAQELGCRGADVVYHINHPQLETYTTEAYRAAMLEAIGRTKPDVILLPHTAIGKDLAPRLAARLQIGLISDCTELDCADGELVFTRPIYAGKAFERRKTVAGTCFATIRPNNFPIPEQDNGRKFTVQQLQAEIPSLRAVVRDIAAKTADAVDLAEAKIVVSGGRGVKSEAGFTPLRELAAVLGAAVGASRGACDAGYCDYALQIGQTGKVVTPDLYIACGISGAIQHLAGMSGSKVIVAINKDPEAPIFQVADYGIVGDLFEVVPLLTGQFRQLLGK